MTLLDLKVEKKINTVKVTKIKQKNLIKIQNQHKKKMMQEVSSMQLSVLQNRWQSILEHTFDHSLNEQKVCTLAEDLPEIKQLKQKYPEINVRITQKNIKPISTGIYVGSLDHENKLSGHGIIRYEDKSIVEARFVAGKAKGKGYKYFGPGWYYVGDFDNNNFHGKGEYISPDIQYIGEFANNTFHGQGKLRLPRMNSIFIGMMENGEMKNGNLTWQAKNPKNTKEILRFQYQGGFVNGKFQDKEGILITKFGKYKGGFKNGMKQGLGRFQFNDKYQYIGLYEQNDKKGFGTLYNPAQNKVNGQTFAELSELDKDISYQGEFDRNLPHGKGKIYKDGKLIQAEYEQGIWVEALRNAVE